MVEQLLLQGPRRGAQPAREATLALRFGPLTRCPPRHRQAEGLPAAVLWAVQVREVDPPAEVKPIEWLLLTTVAVRTVDDARERVAWYACRWGIEVWHRLVEQWRSYRSAPAGHRRALGALLDALQRHGLAGVLGHHVGAGGARAAV